MSKRHFMSILGTGAYSECTYKFNDDIFRTRFIQEALLSFNDFTKEDRMTIFLTEKARELNFKTRECGENDCKCNKYKPGDILIGLGEILKNKYGDSIEIVDIADGKTEDEQWEIFSTIFENIKDDEEIVFDITHGFRTIPMLAFAVLNYARVLKNISLNSIYYGAFEAKYDDGTVPIWNCTSYIDIMDWT